MKSVTTAKNRLTVLLLCTLILVALAASQRIAYAQNDAFSVEVAVSERSNAEQKDGYTAGLRRILLNNSGDKTILNRDQIREALRQAEAYVQAVSYRRPPPGTVLASDTPITSAVQQSGQATQLMLVSFDRQLVSELIADSASDDVEPGEQEAQAPTPLDSDSALVWLLIRDEGRDILISDPAAVNVQTRAREIAGAAGISLAFPAGDTEDLTLVSTEDLESQSFDDQRLLEAASRYAQETVLFGYLSRNTASGWLGQWTRVDGTTQTTDQFDTSNLDTALQEGLALLGSVGQLDETYRYGGSAQSDAEGLVWVGSLDTIDAYSRMMNFFKDVRGLGTVYPKEVQSDYMVFSVIPRSSLSSIESALANAPFLQRSTTPVISDADPLVRNADLALEFSR